MECTCGSNLSSRTIHSGEQNVNSSVQIDASYVQLPPSLLFQDSASATSPSKPTPATFLEQYQDLLLLEEVAYGRKVEEGLCRQCVERVRSALEADCERLERECQMYREAIKEEERREESTARALRGYWTGFDHDAESSTSPDTLLQSYQREIEAMEKACNSQIEELKELSRLRNEQVCVAKELDAAESEIEEQHNALELEARGFDAEEEQARKQLSETVEELENLSSTQISLPAMVLNLKVDRDRGLRYPLINDLRLAYRPKGDVDKYKSRYWKIVPLSSGAKLIHHNSEASDPPSEKNFTVYNLGHPQANGAQALLAWNNLMHGVVQHASSVLGKEMEIGLLETTRPKSPFDMTPTSVGGISLVQLNANDDAGWSRAIHCMACNLFWLSEVASRHALTEVLLQSQV